MKSAAQRERARVKKQRQRAERAELARLAALAEAERIEREDAARERHEEAIVSSALRRPVVTVSGVMLLGPRIQVVAGAPARVDPLAALKLTERRRRAGRQLQTDWREVGSGIGVKAVDHLRSGGGGSGDGGSIRSGGAAHEAMRRQIDTHARLMGAMTAAGALAPFLARVVLDGVPLDVAEAEFAAHHRLAPNGRGWLDAGLDRIAGFYWPAREGVSVERVLTFGPAREAYEMEVVDE